MNNLNNMNDTTSNPVEINANDINERRNLNHEQEKQKQTQ